ncbi:phosphoethanolamine transferase [Anaerobiospirillum succiniciproducens]|uniref:phosphoethanolamine transferase n=1 Tax=Anaerobiospirillum succiniciproducens TaxID=13335 RepID=UPI002942B6E2|nr:phosphoethanolamine transferase [Anaerobiospirillum succiniciproducens]
MSVFKTLNYNRAALIFACCASLIIASNFLLLGSYSRVYGIAGHSISTAIFLTLVFYICAQFRMIYTIYALVYLIIILPTYLLSTSLQFTGLDYKTFAKIVSDGNMASLIFAAVITVISITISNIANSYVRAFVVSINALLLTLLFIHFIMVIAYALNYGSGPSSAAITALFQTNIIEAYEFVISQGIIGYVASFILLICSPIVFFGAFYINYRIINTQPLSYISAVVLILIGCSVLYNLNLRVTYNSYFATIQTWIQQKDFKEAVSARANMLDNLNLAKHRSEDGLFVLVIGESLTRDHMSVYGYERNTTPWQLRQKNNKNFILFEKPYSSSVTTTASLSLALTSASLKDQATKSASEVPSIVEMANAYGFETTWISNQSRFGFAELPQTIIADAADNQFWLNKNDNDYAWRTESFDEVVLSSLNEALSRGENKKLVIIHLMGQHGNYNHRYPNSFRKWPGNDSDYDNSILYNDYVLKLIHETVSKDESFKAMVYFSDHGEELGIGHTPDSFTYTMARIPFWIAVSERFYQDNTDTVEAMKSHIDRPFTNDLLFDIVCGLTKMKNHPFYRSSFDITSKDFGLKADDTMILNIYKVKDDPNF